MNRVSTTASFANIDIDSDSDDENLFDADLLSEAIKDNTEESGLKQVDRGFANDALEMDMRKLGLFDFMSKSRAFEDNISAYMKCTIVINNIAPPHEIKNDHDRFKIECKTLINSANVLIKLYPCGDALNKYIVNNVLSAVENFQTCLDELYPFEDNNIKKTTLFNLRVQLFNILKTIANDPYIPAPEDPNTPSAAIHARYKLLSLKQLQYSKSDYPTIVVSKDMQSLTRAKEWLDQNQHLLIGQNEYSVELQRTHQEAASSRGNELIQLIQEKQASNSDRNSDRYSDRYRDHYCDHDERFFRSHSKNIGTIDPEIFDGVSISESTLKTLSADSYSDHKQYRIFSEKYIQHLQKCATDSNDYVNTLESLSRKGLTKFVPLLALQALIHLLKDDALFKYIKKDPYLQIALDGTTYPTLSKNISKKLLKRDSFWESHSFELLTHPSSLIRKHATKTYAKQVAQERDKQAALQKIRDASYKLIKQRPESIDDFSKKILLPNKNALTKLDWEDLESIIRFTIKYNGKYLNKNKVTEENIRYYLPLCWINKINPDTDGSDDYALNKSLSLLKIIGYPENPAWICKAAEARLIRSIDKCSISALKYDVILKDIGLRISNKTKMFGDKLNNAIITRIQNNADKDNDASNMDKQLGRLKDFIENGVNSLSTYIRPIIGDNPLLDSNIKEPSERARKYYKNDVQISESLKRTAIIRFVELSYQYKKHEILMSLFNTSNQQLCDQILRINEISGRVKDFPYIATDQQLSQYLECKALKEYAEKEIKRRESNKQSLENIKAIPYATASGLYKGGAWAAQSMLTGIVSAAKATGQGAVVLGQGTVGMTKATTRAAVNLSKATVETTATAAVATAKTATGALIGMTHSSMLPFTYAASQVNSHVKHHRDQTELNNIFTQDLSHNDLVEIARGSNMEKLKNHLKRNIDLNQHDIKGLSIETLQQRSLKQLSKNRKIDTELVNALETLSADTGLTYSDRTSIGLHLIECLTRNWETDKFDDSSSALDTLININDSPDDRYLIDVRNEAKGACFTGGGQHTSAIIKLLSIKGCTINSLSTYVRNMDDQARIKLYQSIISINKEKPLSENYSNATQIKQLETLLLEALTQNKAVIANKIDLAIELISYDLASKSLRYDLLLSLLCYYNDKGDKGVKSSNFIDRFYPKSKLHTPAFKTLLSKSELNTHLDQYKIDEILKTTGSLLTSDYTNKKDIDIPSQLESQLESQLRKHDLLITSEDLPDRLRIQASYAPLSLYIALGKQQSSNNNKESAIELENKALPFINGVLKNCESHMDDVYDKHKQRMRDHYDVEESFMHGHRDRPNMRRRGRNMPTIMPKTNNSIPKEKDIVLTYNIALNAYIHIALPETLLSTLFQKDTLLKKLESPSIQKLAPQHNFKSELSKKINSYISRDYYNDDDLRNLATYSINSTPISVRDNAGMSIIKRITENTNPPYNNKDLLIEMLSFVKDNRSFTPKVQSLAIECFSKYASLQQVICLLDPKYSSITLDNNKPPIPIEKKVVKTHSRRAHNHLVSKINEKCTIDELIKVFEFVKQNDTLISKASEKIKPYIIQGDYDSQLWDLASCPYYFFPKDLRTIAGNKLIDQLTKNNGTTSNNDFLAEMLSFVHPDISFTNEVTSLAIDHFSKRASFHQVMSLLSPSSDKSSSFYKRDYFQQRMSQLGPYSYNSHSITFDNNKSIPINKDAVNLNSEQIHNHLVSKINDECTIDELKDVYECVTQTDSKSMLSKKINSYIKDGSYSDDHLRKLAADSSYPIPNDVRTHAGTKLIELLTKNNDIKSNNDFLTEMLFFVHPDISFTHEVRSLAMDHFSERASLQQVMSLLDPSSDNSHSITLDNKSIPISKDAVILYSEQIHNHLVSKINEKCTINDLIKIFKFVHQNDVLSSQVREKINLYINQRYYNEDELRNLASCSYY